MAGKESIILASMERSNSFNVPSCDESKHPSTLIGSGCSHEHTLNILRHQRSLAAGGPTPEGRQRVLSLDADIPPFDWLMPLAPWEEPEVLSQTLKSLLAQTWQARALVVSVDGEISSPLEQVLRSSGLLIELHPAERWQGTGLVLARGLLACKSEIVLRVDADDISVPERSRWQVEQMMADPRLAVLGGQLEEIRTFEGQSSAPNLRNVPLTRTAIQGLSRWRNPMNHPTVAVRRSKVLSAGNYRACLYFEDWDLWLRMLRKGYVFRNDPRILVRARVGPDHLSRRHGWGYLKAELSFFLRSTRCSLIPAPVAVVLCATRLPLRLLPKAGLSGFMAIFVRRHA